MDMGEAIAVTGGGGFLGSAVTRKLLESGHEVMVIGRGTYPELESLGARVRSCDIRDPEALVRAFEGADGVQHIAALPGVWGPREDFHGINTVGTRNVISACRRLGITKLVYTSTPSVVHGGGGISGKSEAELRYPVTHHCHYAATKAMAEREVLASDATPVSGGGRLRTVALRPHLIWGPGDRNLIPRIVERARAGRLMIIGSGENLVDTVYIDNAADAQILAGRVLAMDPGRIGGNAYFITQGEPVVLWEFINRILSKSGLPPVKRRIPFAVAWLGGLFFEAAHSVLAPSTEPVMTRFLAEQLGSDHYFDPASSRDELGYIPAISTEEGLERLGKWLRST